MPRPSVSIETVRDVDELLEELDERPTPMSFEQKVNVLVEYVERERQRRENTADGQTVTERELREQQRRVGGANGPGGPGGPTGPG